jgi:AbiV family abortive infection protein
LPVNKEIPENILVLREACLSQASDLIRAANRILVDENLPSIAFNLCVLALEEIGKSTLIVMDYFASLHKDSNWSPKNYYDDHIKKLFWATWGPSFDQGKISSKEIESLQGLSKNLHNSRLQSLYVDFDSDGPLEPKDAICKQEADTLLKMASARLEMEKAHKFGKIDDEKQKILKWFMSATSELEKRKLIFGNKSIAKLKELGSVTKWINWLKKEFDQADEEAKIAAQNELKRKVSEDATSHSDKWKVKIRLFTNSHSIRPKVLNDWNRVSSWIKLFPVGGKKNQLILEMTLRENITIHQLWWASWGVARRFVAALNIGSFGYFWWYIPEQISRFYEQIVDLKDEQMGIKLERNPKLILDWKNDSLSDVMLQNTALCFAMMPNDNESELGQSLGAYLTGLGFLSKTDIHLQFEANSYEFFYKSLKHTMKHFQNWDGVSNFSDIFVDLLGNKFKIDSEEIEKHKNLSAKFEGGRHLIEQTKISLSEVGFIKIICDVTYINNFRQMAHTKSKKEKN